MQLTDLEPSFGIETNRVSTWTERRPDGSSVQVTGPKRGYREASSLATAQGLWFLCPKCFAANNGPVGTHSVMVGFAGRCPPGSWTQGENGQDTRWSVSGTGFHDLTLNPSIWLKGGGCGWHGRITAGDAA